MKPPRPAVVPSPRRTRRLAGLVAVLALGFVLSGCADKEQIHTYQVPKVRFDLVAAIVPHGDDTWFFKLAGERDLVAPHREAFAEFIRSLRFKDMGDPVEWTLPPGWEVEEGKGMRYATIHLGPKGTSEVITVFRFGKKAGSILANVNRWRNNDLGLAPFTENQLGEVSRKIEVGGLPVTLIDMTGPGPRGSLRMADGPPVRRLNYSTPEGWVETGPRKGMFSILTAFRIREGGESAEMTVVPLGAQAGSLLDNVNRWRRQDLGVKEIDEEGLKSQDIKDVAVSGTAGKYFDLSDPEAVGGTRVLVVMVTHGNRTWFFKLKGPNKLVGDQKRAFEQFIRSVKINNTNRGDDEE
jgi:hypothetical protein